MLPDDVHRVPADVRQCRRVDQLDGPPGKQAQSLNVTLIAGVKQDLEAETDTETRPTRANPIAQRLYQSTLPKMVHRGTGRTHSGHDDGVHADAAGSIVAHANF